MRYIDMHCDTITRLLTMETAGQEANLRKNNLHVDLEKLHASKYLVQNFAIFTPVKQVEDPLVYALKAIDKYYREIEANGDLVYPVYKAEDIKTDDKRTGALLTVEDVSIIKGDLANLRNLYRLGVRMVGLTWNYITNIGYPNIDMEKEDHTMQDIQHEKGITAFGKEVVEECQRLGMIVDVSHLSDKGFWDVYDLAQKPFVASHSNARAVHNVARNLSDEMIKALSSKGGVMGINFCDEFLSNDGSVNAMVNHIDHIVEVGGIDCVGLGSDFDGIGDRKELKDAGQMEVLATALKEHGYSSKDINKMMYGNVLRVYEEVLK